MQQFYFKFFFFSLCSFSILEAAISDDREKILKIAKEAEEKKEWPTAIQAYENLLKDEPENTDYLFHLGKDYSFSGNNQKAIPIFKEILERTPSHILF